jgi:RNA recognition motif-containing protein
LLRVTSPASPHAHLHRSGPRIFIGKLTKDTSEADVKEYFSRFGYVMDVYMPKSKDNKIEHRGFGFVTFETDAAIKRVVGAGSHKLKGSTIAIDIAIPKVEEEVGGDLSSAFAAGAGLGGPLGLMPPFDPSSAAAAAAAAVAARQFQAQLPMMM